MPAAKPFVARASDGFILNGSAWSSADNADSGLVAIINAGAGIPAIYYHPFASWLADQGIPTYTYDYRGIGASRPPSLKGFGASIYEWGSKDCTGAIQRVQELHPGRQHAVIGHSIGGMLTGFVTKPEAVKRFVFVGGHTGYWRDHARGTWWWMYPAWHVFMPTINRAVGYFPGKLFGLPEDLPFGIAQDWSDRRRPEIWWRLRQSDGMPDMKRIEEVRSNFARFRVEALTISAIDDPFATLRANTRLRGLYVNCNFHEKLVSPSAKYAIGHFGYFRRRAKTHIWPLISEWLLNA